MERKQKKKKTRSLGNFSTGYECSFCFCCVRDINYSIKDQTKSLHTVLLHSKNPFFVFCLFCSSPRLFVIHVYTGFILYEKWRNLLSAIFTRPNLSYFVLQAPRAPSWWGLGGTFFLLGVCLNYRGHKYVMGVVNAATLFQVCFVWVRLNGCRTHQTAAHVLKCSPSPSSTTNINLCDCHVIYSKSYF